MRNYQFAALLGWEADCLALAPGLAAWFIITCAYLNNETPSYVPKHLRVNRYFGRLEQSLLSTFSKYYNTLEQPSQLCTQHEDDIHGRHRHGITVNQPAERSPPTTGDLLGNDIPTSTRGSGKGERLSKATRERLHWHRYQHHDAVRGTLCESRAQLGYHLHDAVRGTLLDENRGYYYAYRLPSATLENPTARQYVLTVTLSS